MNVGVPVLSILRKSIEAAVWGLRSRTAPCTVGQVGYDTTLRKSLPPFQSTGTAPPGLCRVPSEPLSIVVLKHWRLETRQGGHQHRGSAESSGLVYSRDLVAFSLLMSHDLLNLLLAV